MVATMPTSTFGIANECCAYIVHCGTVRNSWPCDYRISNWNCPKAIYILILYLILLFLFSFFFFVAFILNEIRNIDSSIEEQELCCTLIRYRSQFCICFLIVHISLYRSQWTWTWRAFDRVRNKPYLIRSFGMSNWLRGNFLPLSPLYELRTFICVSVVCVCAVVW